MSDVAPLSFYEEGFPHTNSKDGIEDTYTELCHRAKFVAPSINTFINQNCHIAWMHQTTLPKLGRCAYSLSKLRLNRRITWSGL
jgi:hypothetical protein